MFSSRVLRSSIRSSFAQSTRSGSGGYPLEAFKFALYLSVPIGTLYLATNPDVMYKIITTKEYVVYPPAQKVPQTKEERQAYIEQAKAAKQRIAAHKVVVGKEEVDLSKQTEHISASLPTDIPLGTLPPAQTSSSWFRLSWLGL